MVMFCDIHCGNILCYTMDTTEGMQTTESLYENHKTSENGKDFIPMTLPLQIISGTLMIVLIILAVGGNILTIISYIRDHKLNSVYDFYIFNLAIADFLIGCISLPIYTVFTLNYYTWIFGKVFCKIWCVSDFTCCLQTVLLMVILSADRLMLVTYGPFYKIKVTKKRAYIVVAISWLIAFLLYGPSIIGWDYWVGESTVKENYCFVEFAYNFEFTTATAIIEFCISSLILVILNVSIYVQIRKKTKWNTRTIIQKAFTLTNVSVIGEETTNDTDESVLTDTKTPEELSGVTNKPDKNHTEACNIPCERSSDTSCEDELSKQEASIELQPPADQTIDVNPNTITFNKGPKHKFRKRKRVSESIRHVRAARFLAMLVLVFLLCWAPYTFTTILNAFCGEKCVNPSAYEILIWLLWCKSGINPFLYAANSTRYRYNFRRYLSCTRDLITLCQLLMHRCQQMFYTTKEVAISLFHRVETLVTKQ